MAPPLEKTDMYDNALFGILQNVGNVQDFLQIYFGFLYRKTDFYRTSSPNGAAEKMALKKFKKFEQIAEKDRSKQRMKKKESKAVPPPAAQELECAQQQKETLEQNATDAQTAMESSTVSSNGPAQPSQQGDQATAASTSSAELDEQMQFQSNPESYNGAVRDTYCWSQDSADMEVRVNVPETIVRGRQVVVSIQTGSVRVCVRDGAEERVMMEGEFTEKINAEDSLWNLEPGRCVVLSLSKCGEIWWKALLKGEPEIDISKINCERPPVIDEEELATMDKPKSDNKQKLQGKPLTSQEMEVHKMLQMGWDAEDSPFRGQQFDPSLFNIQNTKTLDK